MGGVAALLLLLLRWSCARRGEIAWLLTPDCLHAYPDGYPRLRMAVGKTYTERMVPLHPQAADALRELIDAAKAVNATARHDAWAQRPVRYVFMRWGKPRGRHFLYEDALEIACRKAGLVDGDDNPTVNRPPVPPHGRHPARRRSLGAAAHRCRPLAPTSATPS